MSQTTLRNLQGIDLEQLKYEIVEPALIALGLMSTARLNLCTGTALVESSAAYVLQDNGPALGLWQMEPATEEDCWTNFLDYNAGLAARVRSLLAPGKTMPQLVGNLPYAAAMCAIKYYRAPSALPAARDAVAMAAYHKSVYNTALGAADPALNVAIFQQAISA